MFESKNIILSISKLNLSNYTLKGYNNSFIFLSSCPSISWDNNKKAKISTLLQNFKRLKKRKISLVISLIEINESRKLGLINLPKVLKKIQIKIIKLPIKNMSIPKDYQSFQIRLSLNKILDELKNNRNIIIHCHAGLGRTGILASLILKSFNLKSENSIEIIRKIRPGSIETKEQENFVKDFNI